MNETWALNLIKNTFENSFDRERFLVFAKNLFHFLDTDSFIYRGNLIPDAYDAHIKTLERLGKYEDVGGHKIEVLSVCLNKQSSLERARTLQRNFIAWYLNGSRGGVTKDAALVAFYTKDSDDWRLSLVKMDYHLGESKAGKIKAITELTPARRFSFLVGASENTHTAQRQLLPILKDTDFKPALSDLESAFSVEVVTKDFFEKYKKLFLDTKEALDKIITKDEKIKADFQEKNIDTADFAKKLLGQIVFLYFLQKKGWFGVEQGKDWGTGSKTFLRDLFDQKVLPYDNFFNDVLEPLFYDALARDRSNIDFFNPEFNCKIPFLNGGLFDPLNGYDWAGTNINLPNNLFSNKKNSSDEGCGILDVFDLYNFTVKEDEPLEREVAVDPEMLGKVFENLLELKDRKSKGTYYTPREIVHYMCQESLINYLLTELDGKVKRDDIETLIRLGETAIENEALVMDKGFETKDHYFKLPQSIRDNATLLDEKLEKIHVCDPAVGSGAFLVGMMTEVIRVRNVLTNYLTENGRSIYDFKRHAIQNCLYGVDIDPGAVEIAKLRLWLSLIVDEQDIKQIKPLPNLDYKIMQGNSLLEEYEGIKLFDDRLLNSSAPNNNPAIQNLQIRASELDKQLLEFYQKNPRWMKNKKLDRPSELYQLEGERNRVNLALQAEIKSRFLIKENSNQISLVEEIEKSQKIWESLNLLHKQFFETANKREKDEIKKKIEVLEWELIEATLREKNKLSLLPEIERFKKANIKPFFLWKLNFSEVFEKNGGFDVVIANPPYVTTKYGKINDSMKKVYLKNFFSAYDKIDLYVLFIEQGVRVSKEHGFTTMITPWNFLKNFYSFKIRQFILDNCKIISFLKLQPNVFESVIVDNIVFILEKSDGEKDNKILFDDLFDKDKQKYISQSDYLENDKFIFPFPVDSVSQSILKRMKESSVELGSIALNYIGIMTGDQESMIANGPVFKNSKPVLSGKEVQKWFYKDKGKFVNFDKSKIHSNDNEDVYLSKRKILLRKTGRELVACLDENQFFTIQSLYNIVIKDHNYTEEYILALLNSRLFTFIYNKFFITNPEVFPYIKRRHLDQLPIKKLSIEEQRPFITLVDEVVSLASGDRDANSKRINIQKHEEQIDQLIYKLYGLTQEEIAVIEK